MANARAALQAEFDADAMQELDRVVPGDSSTGCRVCDYGRAPCVCPVGYTEEELRIATVGIANVIAAADAGAIKESDAVNLPHHYARFKIEPIRFAMENNLNFLQANVVKYLLRFDAKNGDEDLRKAQRCLAMLRKFVAKDPDWWKRDDPKTEQW